MACSVERPTTANCLHFTFSNTEGWSLVRERPSSTLLTWLVSEIGLMLLLTDLAGFCLGKGRTEAVLRIGGM